MKILSPAFVNGGNIPVEFTCDGENISPQLQFENVPNETKSLVLIVDDPDAPAKTWVHWILLNIDPNTQKIGKGETPKGATEGMTDFGSTGYGGPCPPSGTHRYFFRLFALDKKLDLGPNTSREKLEQAMVNHIIDQAELMGQYSRS